MPPLCRLLLVFVTLSGCAKDELVYMPAVSPPVAVQDGIDAGAACSTPALRAEAGADRQVPLNCPVVLNGRASDANALVRRFEWRLVSVPEGSLTVLENADAPNPHLTPDREGTYRVSLVLSDGCQESPPALIELVASATNTSAEMCGGGALTSWATIRPPLVIGHRGASNTAAPENTLAGFDYAASLGVALEFDLRSSLDGVLVVTHDSTFTRTTGGAVTGAVSELTADQIALVDVSSVYRSDLFSPQRVPSFETMLRRYGSTHLLLPELKNNSLAEAEQAARLVARYGLADSVVFQSFYPEVLARIRQTEPRLRTVLNALTPPSLELVRTLGVWGVFVDHNRLTAGYVGELHAEGVKVLGWTVSQLTPIESLLSTGADGFATNDPALALQAQRFTPVGTHTVAVPPSLVGSGWRPRMRHPSGDTPPGSWPIVSSGFVSYRNPTNVLDGTFTVFHLPTIRLSAAHATTQTISTTLKVLARATSGSSAQHLGLRFCWATDNDSDVYGGTANPGTGGYLFAHHLDGTVELRRVEGGAATTLATGTWGALAVGATLPLRVDLTVSTLSVTRTDTGEVISATDSRIDRTGFLSIYGSSVAPGLGSTTVTY